MSSDQFQDIEKRYAEIRVNFKNQFKAVSDITKFDSEYLKIVIDILEEVELRLKGTGVVNEAHLPTKALKLLRDLRDKGPQQAKYEPVYNQSVVLLVSYFGSAITDIFNDSLTNLLTEGLEIPQQVMKEAIDLTILELSNLNYDLSKDIGRIIARKADISFQDMQSISRAFKKFFSIEINWDVTVNNIILAQAMRHVIVHHSEIVDEKCVGQLSRAKERKIKPNVEVGEAVKFTKAEIIIIGESMQAYIDALISMLLKSFSEKAIKSR